MEKINKINNKNKPKTTTEMLSLKVNNKVYSSDKEKADLFGSILEETFKDSNDPRFDKKFHDEVKQSFNKFKEEEVGKKSDFKLFTLKELSKELKCLKKRSAVGQDGIHNLFLVNTNNRFRIIL